MTPLQIQILVGKADHKLLDVIDDLNHARLLGGLSPGEEATFSMAWERLDFLTHPTDLIRRAREAVAK